MTADFTNAELERLEQAWRRARADPRERRRTDRLNLRRNLSRMARWRSWWQHQANSAFIWLCRTRKGCALAARLWRL